MAKKFNPFKGEKFNQMGGAKQNPNEKINEQVKAEGLQPVAPVSSRSKPSTERGNKKNDTSSSSPIKTTGNPIQKTSRIESIRANEKANSFNTGRTSKSQNTITSKAIGTGNKTITSKSTITGTGNKTISDSRQRVASVFSNERKQAENSATVRNAKQQAANKAKANAMKKKGG